MQYQLRTDDESGQLSYPESELSSELDTPIIPPKGYEVPKPAPREKAMAASAPGSEYWLP